MSQIGFISIRSTHCSPLLPLLVLRLLETLSKKYDNLPVTICWEFDCSFSTQDVIEVFEAQLARHDCWRDPQANEAMRHHVNAHDAALLTLLRFIQHQEKKIIFLDPPGTFVDRDLYPVWMLDERNQRREGCMVNTLGKTFKTLSKKQSAEQSSLVLDLGGIAHQPYIKSKLQPNYPNIPSYYLAPISSFDQRRNCLDPLLKTCTKNGILVEKEPLESETMDSGDFIETLIEKLCDWIEENLSCHIVTKKLSLTP